MFTNKYEKFIHSYLFILITMIGPLVGYYLDNLSISYYSIALISILILFLSKDLKMLLLLLPIGLTSYNSQFDFANIPIEIFITGATYIISIILMIIKNIVTRNDIKFNFGLVGKSLLIFSITLLISAIVRNIFYNTPAFSEYPEVYNPLIGYLGAIAVILLAILSILVATFSIDDYLDVILKFIYCFGIYLFSQYVIELILLGEFNLNKATFLIGWAQKNQFAIVIEFCLPFIAYIFGKNYKRIDAFILFCLLASIILVGDSRGAQVTICFSAFYLLYLIVHKTKHVLRNYLLMIGIAFVSFCILLFIPQIRSQFLRLFESILNGHSFSEIVTDRDVFWNWTFDYVVKTPSHILTGGSLSYMVELYKAFFPDASTVSLWMCHNTFISALAMAGLLGVIAIIYHFVEGIGGSLKRSGDLKLPLIGVYIFILIHGIIDETLFYIVVFIPYLTILQSFKKPNKDII